MDNGRIAAAVVGGYLLGRTKKMKLAIMVGGALMGKKLPTDPAALLKLAGSVVDKSPELQRLDTAVRGRLMEAGRDAAMSVASSRMETFTDSLVNRVENLGKPAGDAATKRDGKGHREAQPGTTEPAESEPTDAEFEDIEDGGETEAGEETEDRAPADRNGSSRTGSARNGARTGSSRNGSARTGSTRSGAARNGSGRATRRTEAVHD